MAQQNQTPNNTDTPVTFTDSLALKVIGVLGGMSPESTIDYYQRINGGVRRALGSHHSARMLIYSANLEQVFRWMDQEDGDALAQHLVKEAKNLEAAGADFIVMACNTAHKVAPQIENALTIPFVHIVDVLGEHLRQDGHRRVGLLATKITAESPFYRQRLEQKFGIEALAPLPQDCQEVDRMIREELCFQDLQPSSLQRLEKIAEELKHQGAEAIVLACTELGLLVQKPRLAGLPIYDTTALHASEAVALALGHKNQKSASRAA